jgi:hypothetical protein
MDSENKTREIRVTGQNVSFCLMPETALEAQRGFVRRAKGSTLDKMMRRILKESVDIPHAMQNPDNLKTAANRHIKNQVPSYRETSQTRM